MELTLESFAAEVEKSRGLAPKPPRAEQERRLERARRAIESQGLDAILVYGSAAVNADPIRYLAGYVHTFPSAASFLLLPLEAPPVLLVDQAWHVEEARKMSWVEDVRPMPVAARRWLAEELASELASVLASAGLSRGRIGTFEAAMPGLYARVLAASVPDATLADGKPVWEELVASPTDYDVAMIEATARIADEGLAAAVDACGAGTPEYEFCLESLRRMASLGAEFLHGSGLSTHINTGSFSEVVSNVRPFLFSANRVELGQMFWLDLSASYGGCYIDTDRTISIGEPSPAQRELYDVTRAMYEALVEAARPGVRGGDLWEVGNRVAAEAGLADSSNHVYLGHTTGITTSERPVVAPGETGELRAGSFLNVEPGIFVPGVGSACIENTLRIGDDGARAINEFGIDIHVV